MKKTTLKKSPNTAHLSLKNPALMWTVLLNLGLFIGLYLFFRTDIHHTVTDTSGTGSKATSATYATANIDTFTETAAKNIPLPDHQVELISQTLPEMGHATSTTAATETVTALPTLLEPDSAPKALTTTSPISLTKIVRMPQKMSDNRAESDKSLPNLSSTASGQHTANKVNSNPAKVTSSNAESLLTDRDVPRKNQTVTPNIQGSKARGQQDLQRDLEAKTAQLSEAINQVKRLNQQAINNANMPVNEHK